MSSKSQTVVVTGGSGFIGSHIMLKLASKYPSYQLLNIDRVPPSKFTQYLYKNNCQHVPVDLCDMKKLNRLLKNIEIDYVIHLAAQPNVDVSISDPIATLNNNIVSTMNILNLCTSKTHSGNVKKFLYVSTDEVYGSSDSNDAPFIEESNYNPASPYAASKASSELIVKSWHYSYKVPVAITRSSNNYGPNQQSGAVIPYILSCLMGRHPLKMYRTSQAERCWLYVEDHVNAILEVLFSRDSSLNVYNVSSNESISIHEVTNVIRHEYESQSGKDTRKTSPIVYVEDRVGLDMSYRIDINKIRTKTSWVPINKFEDRIKDTVRWYRESV